MSNSIKFKYDYNDYDEDISEAIKKVEESFFYYIKNGSCTKVVGI